MAYFLHYSVRSGHSVEVVDSLHCSVHSARSVEEVCCLHCSAVVAAWQNWSCPAGEVGFAKQEGSKSHLG